VESDRKRRDMSNDIKDGGPAFASVAGTPSDGYMQEGMSLRDYFAGQVLNGIWSDSDITGTAEGFAKDAYHQADAMIAQRNKETS
jgi:hypothetical protein